VVDARLELVIARTSAGGGRKKALVNEWPAGPAPGRGAAGRPVRAGGHAAHRWLAERPARFDRHAGCPDRAHGLGNDGQLCAGTDQRNNLLRAIRENMAAPDELRFWTP
jgi:hypothetical protein